MRKLSFGIAVACLIFAQSLAAQEVRYRYIGASFERSDINLATIVSWMQRFGIEVPFTIDGLISFKIAAQVPWNAPRTGKAYKAQGTATSPKLVIEGITIENAIIELGYDDGVLSLRKLDGILVAKPQSPNPERGDFRGSAVLPLIPRGGVDASLVFDKTPIPVHLPPALGGDADPATLEAIRASGAIQASIPAEVMKDFRNQKLRGTFSANGLSILDYALPTIAFDFLQRDRDLQLTNIVVKYADGEAKGIATVPIAANTSAAGELKLENFDINKLVREFLPNQQVITGRAGGSAAFEWTPAMGGKAPRWTANATLNAPDLQIAGASLNDAAARIVKTDDILQLDVRSLAPERRFQFTAKAPLKAGLAANEVPAKSLFPIVPAGPFDATLALDDIAFLIPLPPSMRMGMINQLQRIRCSGLIHAIIPEEILRDPTGSAFRAAVSGDDLRVEEIRLPQFRFDIDNNADRLKLSALNVRIANGAIVGSAEVPYRPSLPLDLNISWTDIDLAPIAQSVRGMPPVTGTLYGRTLLHWTPPTQQRVAQWTADGSLRVRDFSAFQWFAQNLSVNFKKGANQGEVNASADFSDGSIRLKGFVPLASDPDPNEVPRFARWPIFPRGPLDTSLVLDNAMLPVAIPKGMAKGKEDKDRYLRASGKLEATIAEDGLRTLDLNRLGGNVAATEITVQTVTLPNLHLNWKREGRNVALNDVKLSFAGGSVAGSATLPLDANGGGNANLAVENLQLEPIRLALPKLAGLAGALSGKVDVRWTPDEIDNPRVWTIDANVGIPKLAFGHITVDDARAELKKTNERCSYLIAGKTLGGAINLNGGYAVDPAALPEANQGEVRVVGLHLSRLGGRRGMFAALRPLGGVANLNLKYAHDLPSLMPSGRGFVQVIGLSWNRQMLTPEVRGTLLINEGNVQLRDLSGGFASGRYRSQVRLNPSDLEKSTAFLRFERVDIARILAPWPDLANEFTGVVDGKVRLRWIEGALVSAVNLHFDRATAYKLQIANWKTRVNAVMSPLSGRAEVIIPDSSAEVAMGHVEGSGSIIHDGAMHLKSKWKLHNVDISTMLDETANMGSLGGGKVNGTMNVDGKNVRSFNDLQGTLNATLSRTQVLKYPIFERLGPILGTGDTSPIGRGKMRVRLQKGVYIVERLAIEQPNLKLLAKGTITGSGRVRLDLTATTGQFKIDPQTLQVVSIGLLATGPIPAALLLELRALFANRLVHIRVVGTLNRPVIQILPLPVLPADAFRFFMGVQ